MDRVAQHVASKRQFDRRTPQAGGHLSGVAYVFKFQPMPEAATAIQIVQMHAVDIDTGYVGNLKSVSLEKLMEEKPEQALINAVKGMLPKNRLGRAMMGKLRVFAGPEHSHQAQQPEPLEI